MLNVRVIAIDPSLRNTAIVLADIPRGKIDLSPSDIKVIDTITIETEKEKSKTVRQNSDDLRRSREINKKLREWEKQARIAFAEIPSGAQNARAALSFGVAIGFLGSLEIPVVEVQPNDRGMVVANRRSVSKHEVINWAVSNFPSVKWRTRKSKGQDVPIDANEHVADALAILIAGTRKPQYVDMAKMMSILR